MDSWIEIRPLPDVPGLSRRVAERAAWRAIVRERLGVGVLIGYNQNGAPVLENGNSPVTNSVPTTDNTPATDSLPATDNSPVTDSAPATDDTPVTGGAYGYISISHTRGWVAVVWSPGPCAIDIELKTRRLSAAAAERYSISSIEDWCALEAEYKYEGLTGRKPAPGSVRFLPHPELVVAVIR